ncbi:hypothetical protein [Cupriavidus sp. CP313]
MSFNKSQDSPGVAWAVDMQAHLRRGTGKSLIFEKVLSGFWPNFLRAAGALGIFGRGGPASTERIHSAAFLHPLKAPAEVGNQLAFARILPTRHFRLFQHNGPEAGMFRIVKKRYIPLGQHSLNEPSLG